MIFQGIRTSIAKKPYIFAIVQGIMLGAVFYKHNFLVSIIVNVSMSNES